MHGWSQFVLGLYRAGAVAFALALIILNGRLYHGPGSVYARPALGPDVIEQLHGLRASLDAGAGDEMQALFPEGYFFMHVLYGLSWVEVGLRSAPNDPIWREALAEARWARDRLASPAGRAPFDPDLTPAYGAFYVGWCGWLDGGIQLMQPAALRPAAERAAYEATMAELAAAFQASRTPYLESYPGQAWPVDSVVAAAALRLHDQVAEPLYDAVLERWLTQVDAALDPATGLLPHRVSPSSGAMLEGARGTSQTVSARFLIEVDATYGATFYARYREQFVRPFLGVPGVVEWPADGAPLIGAGDVDSGPLLFGFSASATMVALAAAQANGDDDIRDALIPATEAVGLPWSWGGRKTYALGLIPIGDAFIVWAQTSSRWAPGQVASDAYPMIVSPGWRLPFHIVTLSLLVGVALPELWLRTRPRRSRVQAGGSSLQPAPRKGRTIASDSSEPVLAADFADFADDMNGTYRANRTMVGRPTFRAIHEIRGRSTPNRH